MGFLEPERYFSRISHIDSGGMDYHFSETYEQHQDAIAS